MRPFIFLLLFLGFSTCYAQSSEGKEYVIKKGDRLFLLAKEHLNDATAYPSIVEATNAKASEDSRFKVIKRPRRIRAGQRIWIPAPSSTTATNNAGEAAPADDKGEATIVAIPKTNCEIRIWYNYQVVAISPINKYWIKQGVSLEDRAKRAYDLRHQARINARYMMQNKTEVAALRARDQTKYGNPDGPTFEYLLHKGTSKGKTREEALEGIIESSSRTSAVYNSECE